MKKNPKKLFQKDKEKDKDKEKNIKSQKDKIKNNKDKNDKKQQIQPNTKINQLKINKANTETKKYRNIKVHNSISYKEEVKNKISPTKKRNKPTTQNLMTTNTYITNYNRLYSSNYFYHDKDIKLKDKEKENENKVKKNKNIKNYSNGEQLDLPDLIFKKNLMKKTIIIDNEGNNNLNLDIEKGENDYKKILDKKNEYSNSILSNSFSGNTETNSLFENSNNKSYRENLYYNYCNNINKKSPSKDDDLKQTMIDKNEEEKRLKEYNKIFNLLNSNIEQFKRMFISNKNSNINNDNNNDADINIINNNNINYSKNKKIIIKNKKNKGKKIKGSNSHNKDKTNSNKKSFQSNLKKNLSEKNLSSMNKYNINNKNLFPINNANDYFGNNNEIKNEINNNCSFLESSIQDDFYQSLINQTFLQNISHSSFEMNSDEISKNNKIIEKKYQTNINENNNNKDKDNDIMDLDIDEENENDLKNKENLGSPILRKKNINKENIKEKNNEGENDYNFKTYLNNLNNYIDRNNCIII